ncbi:MAG: hypothetical protein CFE26_16515 [Verrucomicrobiales bacterium VVV1]|nr:MAG: hypothetical protein CFE26_16515 [Verrucomicrobiales bacterium VVV1]
MKILILAALTAISTAGGESLKPLESHESWTFGDPAAWSWSKDGGTDVLTLKQPSKFKPGVRSPFNLAWLKTADWASFSLTVEARLTKFDEGNNDLCLAFARQDETRFYYAHLGEKADEVHHQLHLVDHADRKPVTATRSTGTPWKPGAWHKLKLTHDSATGAISVYFDDMQKPVLTAQDKTLDHGWIGLGSFDDLGEFRNLLIEGTRK